MLDMNLRRQNRSTTLSARAHPAAALARAAGRARNALAEFALEQIEPRVMLAGDHPSLPAPWVANPPADVVTLNTAAAATAVLRGRGSLAGVITAGDPGDLFKFVVTGAPGRTKDFVSILADTTSVIANNGLNGTPNNGFFLDTFVEVYDSNGTLIQTGADNGSGLGLSGVITLGVTPVGSPALPASQRAPDGWAGFEGTVGATYYIRVKADPNAVPGRDSVGRYSLRIDAATIAQAVNTDPDVVIGTATVPNIDFGRAFAEDTLTGLQDDIIYRVTTPDDARFSGLATFQAVSDDNTVLNPHIDIYSAGNTSGVVQRLATDTDAGRQTDSYTTYFAARATTYYIRVRADDLVANPARQPAGKYQMVSRFAANNIAINPETRLGQTGRVVTAHDDPAAPWTNVPLRTSSMNMNPRLGTDSQLFKFTAQGTGLGIVSVLSQRAVRGMTVVLPMIQPALRLYDETGASLDFNKGTGFAQLLFSVIGNHTYFLVVEGFDNAADGGFQIFIEAHHTNDVTEVIDDHINTPTSGSLLDWQLATPLRFGDPFQPLDNEGNPSRDRTWLQTAVGRGRIQGAGDTDVFQFTAPVNQLSVFPGDDGNQTTPLYVGGNFAQSGTDPRTGQPYNSHNVAIFDAGSWFGAGGATEALGAINGPIFAMAVWDVRGGNATNGPVLAVGGRFNSVNGLPAGTAGNIAFRVFDAGRGTYVWSLNPLNTTSMNPIRIGGPVFALGAGDVIPPELQGNVAAPELYIGGQFTGPGNINNIEALYLTPLGLGIDDLNNGVTGGAAPVVRAITFWDPPAPPAFPARPAQTPATTVTAVSANLPDLPTQVYFGGTFATGFANNPNVFPAPANLPTPAIPGRDIPVNNIAHWGVRNAPNDTELVLQGNGLPNGYNITWGETMPTGGIPLARATATGYGVNGTVNALTLWDDSGQRRLPGDPMLTDVPQRLIIGGSFTSSGTVTGGGDVPAPPAVLAANIIAYDYTRSGAAAIGTAIAGPRYQALSTGFTQGTVRALATWRAATITNPIGNDMFSVLLAAGDNTATGGGIVREFVSEDNRVIAGFPQGLAGGAWATLITADNGTIRALTTFRNNAIGVAPGTNPDGTLVDFETVYIGGDFTMLGAGAFVANHVARLELRLNIPALFWRDMGGGTVGLSPGEVAPPGSGVYALTTFNDNINGVWDRNERAATRVSIRLFATPDSLLGVQSQIRVYDSNFRIIYDQPTNPGALNLDPTGQNHVPGANDPSLNPLFPNAGIPGWVQPMAPFPGFQVWAGEVYYVEVSDTGNGTGRYNLQVNTDAVPPRPTPVTQDTLGAFPDGISRARVPVGEGQFATAPEIQLDGLGKGRPFLNPLVALPATSSYSARTFGITPAGITRFENYDTPTIARVTDTQIFQFRAQNDGTAEVRLSTFGIVRSFQEQSTDIMGMLTSLPRSKTINSPFHGALRIFNNDFVQVGYSDNSQAVQGFGRFTPTFNANPNANPPENGNRAFLHSDPRMVFTIERGKTYFIQIESAYRGTFESNPDLVDWRFATGAYDLSINSTPSFQGVDDHWPNFDFGGQNPVDGLNGTVIPIDRQTGAGTISGVISNVPNGPFPNPNDIDTFMFIAEGRGQTTVRVNPGSPIMSPRVRVFVESVTNNTFTYSLVTSASGGIGGAATATFPVSQGERFYLAVDGSGTEGSYSVTVASPVQGDDQFFSNATPNDITHPLSGWANAKGLLLNRFLGVFGVPGTSGAIAPLQGSIENPSDQDIYRFTAETFEIATASVNRLDPTLNTRLLVYEINRDGAGKEVFLRIADNDDIDVNNTNSRVQFSITPGRDYYIIVQGSSRATDFGRYTLSVNVNPTDDHPNQNDFPSGTVIGLVFDPINFTSTGTVAGNIEIPTDTDLFRFTAPASGTGSIVLSRTGTSTLALDMLVLDANNTPLAGVTFVITASSITASVASITQGQQYYVLVRHKTPVPVGSTDTGAYSLSVTTNPIDDYLPTPGTATPGPTDFAGAANIALNAVNGIGTINGVLVPTNDSDLFKFTTLASGPVTVRVSTPASSLNPRVVIYDTSHTQVFAANGNGDSASVTFNASGIAQYFILVIADPSAIGSTAVGGYTVTASSTLPGGGGGGGPDDFPNAGEWNDAANIGLDTRTGLGTISGVISPAGDTDLFKFTVSGDGIVDMQLNTPSGGLVDGQLKVYNSSRVLVFQDSAGILGATAALKFSALAGEQYFVLVEPVGSATGSYTLRVDAQPVTHFLYFPEGFAGSNINEYVPFVNPNNFSVNYQVFARYETGANPLTPIFTGTIPANTRRGITVSQRDNPGAALVRIGVPYSLEVRSTGPLGATFSHYDFSSAIGESFTDRVSTTWTFGEVNKDRNNYRDFLLFYNPGSVTANLNVTLYYQNGTTHSFMTTVDGLRRGGIAVDTNTNILTSGKFGVKITSDQPIVSSLSSYNLPRSGGDGLLGDADGGATQGVVTNVSAGAGVTTGVSFVNTSNQAAIVTFTADYGRTDLPKLVRVFTVPANSQFNRDLATLGLISGQTAGLTYTSNIPVTMQVTEYKLGDGDSSTTATFAARQFFFGDLFVNPALAGISYIEQLGLYNPSAVAVDVVATFIFNDGSAPVNATFRIEGSTFKFVQIDQQSAILSRPSTTPFSLVLTSATPIVAGLTHYDLINAGGWSAIGAPIGLTNPLSTLNV